MFNNPTLSDVKIKQVYEGKMREYHAHKAVLCLESGYFLNAFTGGFRVRKRLMVTRDNILIIFRKHLRAL